MITNEKSNKNAAPEAKSKTRLYAGIIILILALSMPVWVSLIVAALALSSAVSTVVIGLSVAGGPEVLLVLAAAVMGKDALNSILGKVGNWFKRSFKLSENVSKGRYNFGLVLFWGSILIRWGVGFFHIPATPADGTDWGIITLISLEVITVISVFVLGANFWEKLVALFRWNTRAVTIDEQTK